MKKYFFAFALLLAGMGVNAQSIWDAVHLQKVKQSLSQPMYAIAYKELMLDAEQKLNETPYSVMMKDRLPASGDKHDYMSLARYFWPDPSKPDGKPYISRDGVSNPELEKLDRTRLSQMASNVSTLSLAYYFSGNEKFAQKAVEQIRVWFLNKDTRMNPNLNFAQVVLGKDGDRGRSYGVIDSYSFVEMLDAVQLLEQSKSFTKKDSKELKAWFEKFLHWMLVSKQGMEEANQKNNHSVAYDVQVIAFAIYTDKMDVAKKIISEFPEKRIFQQIEPDGSQPQELRRTLAFGYSEYNLKHMIEIFAMGRKLGLPIDNSTSADGRNFYKAMDFLVPYVGKDVKEWPYKQISEWEYKQQEFCKDLYRAYLLNPARTDYLHLYTNNRNVDFSDRFNLLFVQANETDNAYAFATEQLAFAIKCTKDARAKATNKELVSPRTVEKDGALRLVRSRDWCSGFFPGTLWQLYAFNGSDYWRQQAISHTWPIEDVKSYKGTHDLGFMIYNSFGKAYQLTGERSYKDVALQAARTLITRYNDTVKCIRSWDHNRDKWTFPVIIDNMMNLELLFWATQQTGDSTFYKIAVNHANTTMKNHFRSDFSSYHVVDYNPGTGEINTKCTHQGIADDSFWSRGQGWALYGYAMCYRFTKDPAYLKQAEAVAKFFLNLPNMPDDLIPYWDMKDPAIPNSPRDASAAAIIASGLYELASFVTPEKKNDYLETADKIVSNLHNHYQAAVETHQGFLLLHSTGNYPAKDEIDVPISYADYYYMEALARKRVWGR